MTDNWEFVTDFSVDTARPRKCPQPFPRDSSTLSATSSERRKAPAKPTRMIARLRSSRREAPRGIMLSTRSLVAALTEAPEDAYLIDCHARRLKELASVSRG